MKLLYLSNGPVAADFSPVVEALAANHQIKTINLAENVDYPAILEEIKAADQVISVQDSGVTA